MKKRTAHARFLVPSSSSWILREAEKTALLPREEFENISCTEVHQGTEKGQNGLVRVRVMETCIVQWKVTRSAMEICAACNGKFHVVQWKVYLYM